MRGSQLFGNSEQFKWKGLLVLYQDDREFEQKERECVEINFSSADYTDNADYSFKLSPNGYYLGNDILLDKEC